MIHTPEKVHALLKRYGIHPPVTDKRFAAHADLERGTRLRIVCEDEEDSRGRITVTCNDVAVSRLCPLHAGSATSLVDELRERHLIPDYAQESSTLERLLLRCSDLYCGEDLERLTLSPVFVRENDYRVGAVEIAQQGALESKPRLSPDAHDKGAVFAYRPTARGRDARKNRGD